MAVYSQWTSLSQPWSLLGRVPGQCCYGDLTGNLVVRIKWFSWVKEDKAIAEDDLRQYSCLVISLSLTFVLLYLKRVWKHSNGKPMAKSEAKCERFWTGIQSAWAFLSHYIMKLNVNDCSLLFMENSFFPAWNEQ
jgi:hypothetical protein